LTQSHGGTVGARSGLAGLGTGSVAIRLFLTCWLVYAAHFATDVVREHYPTIALGDDLSFRLDAYANLHPDLFETESRGWRQGNNPGIAFFAAVPYALARPLIDPIAERVRQRRAASGAAPPEYDTPWPNQRAFFEAAWQRGLDVKLGLAVLVTQWFFMAPLCAFSAVLVFLALTRIFGSRRTALWLAVLYAFATPVFYRAAFLNHNVTLGIITFGAFLVLWDPWRRWRLSSRNRYVIAGLAGGLAVLFDYSGIVFLGGLFAYAVLRDLEARSEEEAGGGRLDPATAVRTGALGAAWYAVGAIGPMALLWFYQWQSFGHPFLPPQHWMPPVEWIELGYQGYGVPKPELFLMLGFDHRFGLFVFSPLLLLALAAPLVDRGPGRVLPARETWFILLMLLGLWIFFSGSNYTRLQYNTGVRYMSPIIPFLFLPAAAVFQRFRPAPRFLMAIGSVALMWSLSMYREVERPLGVLDPLARTLIGGFQLPALQTL
jgi:hypothetical protein